MFPVERKDSSKHSADFQGWVAQGETQTHFTEARRPGKEDYGEGVSLSKEFWKRARSRRNPMNRPKKGSPEAYRWAEKMRKHRERIRAAGKRTEEQFFGKGGPLEVKNPKEPAAGWKVSYKEVKSYKGLPSLYYPVVISPSGEKRILEGDPLTTPSKAKHYARLHLFGHNRIPSNPGADWHQEAAHIAEKHVRTAVSAIEKALYKGMQVAHEDSARAAKAYKTKDTNRIKSNPLAIYNPPAEVAGVIYNNAIEIRAEKTGGSLKGFYKHIFESKNVQILGLTNGDVLLHHKGGKRLWISQEDYERSGRRHE